MMSRSRKTLMRALTGKGSGFLGVGRGGAVFYVSLSRHHIATGKILPGIEFSRFTFVFGTTLVTPLFRFRAIFESCRRRVRIWCRLPMSCRRPKIEFLDMHKMETFASPRRQFYIYT
jgi:hypothetical protein